MPPQIRSTNLCGIDQGFLSGRNVGGCHCDVGHGRAYDPVRDFWTQEVAPSNTGSHRHLWELGDCGHWGKRPDLPHWG